MTLDGLAGKLIDGVGVAPDHLQLGSQLFHAAALCRGRRRTVRSGRCLSCRNCGRRRRRGGGEGGRRTERRSIVSGGLTGRQSIIGFRLRDQSPDLGLVGCSGPCLGLRGDGGCRGLCSQIQRRRIVGTSRGQEAHYRDDGDQTG